MNDQRRHVIGGLRRAEDKLLRGPGFGQFGCGGYGARTDGYILGRLLRGAAAGNGTGMDGTTSAPGA